MDLARLLSVFTGAGALPNPADLLRARAPGPSNDAGVRPPGFSETSERPVKLTKVVHPDGRLSQYPPAERWNDWVEWDGKAWPKRVARRYTLVPTICFNCESGCGLLAYVDKDTYEIRKFEGNPQHPGSRGRNCAKGPATHNQTYDPERILYPLKRVGERGEGKWKRIGWDQAVEEISAKMRASREKRRDGIMYHVGRPGEDHYTNRILQSWGCDAHNSHTNICSASSRLGYWSWAGFDRPSPDYANAQCILLISAHLETGHYFNPHAQRIMEAKKKGATLITMDPRLSNTASKSDIWMPTWPGSESAILLAIAHYLVKTGQYNRAFVERWVDWQAVLTHFDCGSTFDDFEQWLLNTYAEWTFERAAEESQVPIDRIEAAAEAVARAGTRLSTHNWRAASIGNRGGWQVTRCLFLLNVLTGAIGTKGGVGANSWHKFKPKPYKQPPAFNAWNELHLPHEWPFAHFEMSFLLPHFLREGRGEIDVYFTRVYNPMWINPDGFMWHKALMDTDKMKCHVALTPTWNESAWFADYVLPMGHAGERHDVMSQETHAGQWIGFRQPVRRVAMERAGKTVNHTWEANPGEVWEENEWWVEVTWAMDPDNELGIREWVESIEKPGTPVTQDEYWGWIFEHSVPGLPEAAAAEDLTALAYMRKYGCFEVASEVYLPYEQAVTGRKGRDGLVKDGGKVVGLEVGGEKRAGFNTPSRKLEWFSATLHDWGWSENDYCLPWPLKSHVHPDEIDRDKGEMLLLPNFRLPTLIHTRSANAKWLVEISHNNPVWMNPIDARRLKLGTGDLVRVETRIGWFVDKVWVTEGIKPGIVAMSHHLGRWRLADDQGVSRQSSSVAKLEVGDDGSARLNLLKGASAFQSSDPDTSRIWWEQVGVHQNLTHAVQPDPVSGAHCWLQKALSVRKALPNERYGDVFVDTNKSMEVYREWLALTRSAVDHSPDGTRRPMWLKRPLRPVAAAYVLPEKPWGR
jgi:anaerobic selenocysteine-containing dehydrogenase